MNNMNSKTTFAVVDIETTGTDLAADDRTIQFSCCLVSDNKITDTFVTDINPQREVPNRIVQLTGITNDRLTHAPTFDQVAAKLYGLLNETVFVAHNVNFDFPFLNAEFQRVGYPELQIEAIDTVTMSQILLPTLSSYRLQDLSAYFNIEHDHPHTADSDALATAKLLLILLRQIEELPSTTLQQILNVSPSLPQDTLKVFLNANEVNQKQAHVKKLPGHLKLSSGLVIRRRELGNDKQQLRSANDRYPKTKKAKAKILPDQLESRLEQNKMMNLIYNNYADPQHHDAKTMVIEAPTGIGKSLGYCLPFSYLVSQQKPVVISTSTTYLQFQLQNQTIPMLNQELPFEISSIILKGARHYIDLYKFKNLLFVPDNSHQTPFVKAQILVWLTMTTTGDLDELHLNVDQTPFVWKIQHTGVRWLDPSEPFYEDDFLRYNLKRAKLADFIIVNHTYLIKNWQYFKELPVKPYLLIDETQQFAETAIKNNQEKINPLSLITIINKILASINQNHEDNIGSIIANNAILGRLTDELADKLTTTKNLIHQIMTTIFSQVVAHKKLHRNVDFFERLIPITEMKDSTKANQGMIQQLRHVKDQIDDLLVELNREVDNNANSFTNQDFLGIYSFFENYNHFNDRLRQLLGIIDVDDQSIEQHVTWVTINHVKDVNSLTLNRGILKTEDYLTEHIYSSFEPTTFTGATIFSSRRSQFIYDLLGIDRQKTAVKRLKSDFNPANQARLYLVTDESDAKFATNSDAYLQQVATNIEAIYGQVPRQTLVLFNSLNAIERTYRLLQESGFTANHFVLAQGVHGTATKISKQFIHHEPAILLGANTFWQGVDFPHHLLENLIVAQLPFDTPADPYNHARYSIERSKGKNPFYSITLPKATLRLRQGMGRLLRTRDDYGTIFILDPRLLTKRYGSIVLANLRNEIPIVQGDINHCIADMVKFFESKA
ncbi:DnaQ family exonuclease DinG family helicase [Lentilactobacillus kisonensis DSM 19906 = JCM 15041]|uniref:3'-5' exonuclease DinG n=2 Tax=Lentilactobacillus kisonensis TaxID=481722 RepID=A0A0R1P4K5_9LACO|nr:DnaQ family exonuclease DinG family helicase [Lentilactobacillus kisonensis DSM 19906 = JCM 15041]